MRKLLAFFMSLFMLLSVVTFSYAFPRIDSRQTETEVRVSKINSGKRTISLRHAKIQQCFTSFLNPGFIGKFRLAIRYEALNRIKFCLASITRSSFQQSDHGLQPCYTARCTSDITSIVTG